MNKKIGVFVASSFLVITILLCVPLVSSQDWDWCIVSAYGTIEIEAEIPVGSITFTVANLPTGTTVTNTMSVSKDSTGDNYTITLNSGDRVIVTWLDMSPSVYTTLQGSEPSYKFINFEGRVWAATVNGAQIPEFPAILITPLFIALTLLAILYRRKPTK
jgi:hypothetical protein